MATQRPVIKIELTTGDKIVEAISWALLVTFWAVVLINYPKLPATIATHYNISGEVDDHGSKTTVFLIPVVATFLFLLLTFVNRYPRVFNYPSPITAENARDQYTTATRLIRYMKIAFLFSFMLIGLVIMQPASGGTTNSRFWLLPASIGVIFIPIAIYLPKLIKSRKK